MALWLKLFETVTEESRIEILQMESVKYILWWLYKLPLIRTSQHVSIFKASTYMKRNDLNKCWMEWRIEINIHNWGVADGVGIRENYFIVNYLSQHKELFQHRISEIEDICQCSETVPMFAEDDLWIYSDN